MYEVRTENQKSQTRNLKSAIERMKHLPKIFTIQTLFIVLVLLMPALLHAQGPDGTPGDPDAAAPIDGGLSLLIAGGVGYGIKKMKGKRGDK